ncbi:NAD-dependent malic enzyme [Clostridium estertheticum]|uniref:NAD-dependent malic enzyme n=1 Tax=Clostridium estertheticum subsp. estertheticum TaxID=1552 RepID=A0A1J0GBL1_9CLOT|nr:NAD-dependent malic enzyme [Clostridium estertheticum]APC38740.1 NAD-dependent malic enzyme [Clostridium estertheticum subsp. estertheticum]MBU3074650.1 NAD-dependent malic enzyme [Clostridium estertheticum]MBU3164638.1 NAD-dependent malic enzyme [Clostridium estertheticum]MBZ9615404.1 NAD-dependent malic enzyme [Clostridium estertheticum subsp. laramiense]WAG75290.1 NAD-dependent malic enzyme [Clostridium estertheticum]
MINLKGQDLLRNPYLNKGTAFTKEERKKYELIGLLPNDVRTIEQQEQIIYQRAKDFEDKLEKRNYLMNLYDTNKTLFSYVISKHITEFLPVIYTPTIGDAVINYSKIYDTPKDAVFLSIDHPEDIKKSIENSLKDLDEIKLIVVTDGEGVLGIGDWGVQGVDISIGKLAVYTVAAGVNPKNALPIVIDSGTNNESLLNDPLYLGNKHKRVTGEKYYDFIDKFVKIVLELFPEVLLHWEDFGRGNASAILENYRSKICTFNDDIQGTGVMMVSAMSAIGEVTGIPIKDHKILVFGGGTAGIGISDQILLEKMQSGLSEEDAIKQFYLVDRFGLITQDMDNLTEGQKKYARARGEFKKPLTNLAEIVEATKPTVLIGTSGVPGAFTEEAVRKMAELNEKPAIMPISNPTKLAEAKATDLIKWTDGRALVVTGSPSEPIEHNGVTYTIGQANNALLYPGLGLGIIVAKAKTVSDGMLSAAAHGIASLQDFSKPGAAILPSVEKVREASKLVAIAVVKQAIKEGLNQIEIVDVKKAVEDSIWEPIYK